MAYKIAVYAICKNEVNFVDKWLDSMSEADYICVLDTGSTDGTWEKLQTAAAKLGSKLILDRRTYSPWRFDTPRNDSLALVPEDADICMCTDLDEILVQGWADDFRAAWNPNVNRLYYYYAWSHNKDGSPARQFLYDKCHSRYGWYWKFPVHETLFCFDAINYAVVDRSKIYLHHYPVYKESRGNYLPLLELRAEENPDDFYGLVYLAHEYYYQHKDEECINFINTTVLPRIPIQDDYLCETDLYMFLGKAYERGNNLEAARKAYNKGIAVCPDFRENYLGLARIFMAEKQFGRAVEVLNRMLQSSKRHYSWLETDTSWGYEPYDLLSLAYYYDGNKPLALDYAILAAALNPTDERLQDNVKIIRGNKN